MQVTYKMIEAYQLYRARYLVSEQRVAKAEQGVDRVGWRTFDAPGKRPLLLVAQQFTKALEVGGTASAFHAKNRLERSSFNTIISASQRSNGFGLVQWQYSQVVYYVGKLVNRLRHLSIRFMPLIAL